VGQIEAGDGELGRTWPPEQLLPQIPIRAGSTSGSVLA
jgi:hypothetical protein